MGGAGRLLCSDTCSHWHTSHPALHIGQPEHWGSSDPHPGGEEEMAGSVNKVILVGNLGADPEARSLGSGGEVVNLRLATTESWNDRDGNRQERTEWHRVVIFNENLGKVA